MRHLPAPANAPDARLDLFSRAHFEAPAAAVRRCPEYRSTPLHTLPDLAAEWGVAGLYLKDERRRLGLRSFKALGGTWAVMEAIRTQAAKAAGRRPPPGSLPGRDYPLPEGLEILCASAGNHGQAVAAGARLLGVACRVLVSARTETARIQAIQAFGAQVEGVDGGYDASVAEAAARAHRKGVLLIPDTDIHGDTETVASVMRGYGVLLSEAWAQIRAEGLAPPTHLLVQAGVGGLAGSLAAWQTAHLGRERPRLIVVESARANGLMESIRHGQLTTGGDAATAMTGMDCSQPSPLALNILSKLADDFITAEDKQAQAAQKRMAQLPDPLATSLTGAAGLAPLAAAASDSSLAQTLGLDRNAVVMGIITEAAV